MLSARNNIDFIVSPIIGIAAFFYLCGWEILNPLNSDWMFMKWSDTAHHVIHWFFYAHAPWSWPLTLYNTGSYPYAQSITNADIIPLLAVPFKLMHGVLPAHFHYFGIALLLNFMLQGICGAYLLRQVTRHKLVEYIGIVLLVISPIMLNRMPDHIALSSHWIILLALAMWFSDKKISPWLQWALTLIALLIHPYIWFMVMAIIGMNQIRYWVNDSDKVKSALIRFIPGILLTLLGLYYIGYFSINTTASCGLTTTPLAMDLTSLLNAGDQQNGQLIRLFIPGKIWQFESFQYLGAGIWLGILILFPVLIANYLSQRQWWQEHRFLLLLGLALTLLPSVTTCLWEESVSWPLNFHWN